MQAQLTAKDIACRRGDRLLFKGLSLDCRAGDALHLAGANGVGKSSLIRILAGLLTPFSGAVSSAGAMGLIDERLALDTEQSLGSALAFWQRLDGCAQPERAYEALELGALLDIPVRYLSTGQKKRAALARLLNRNCPIWLLDEPLNGLDAQAQARVEMLIGQHCERGGIAIVASHQPVALPGDRSIAIEEFAA